MMVCAEEVLFELITIIILPLLLHAVPVVSWNDREVSIPEGDNRMVCFSSDIGTAQPYNVMVGARGKGASAAMRGICTLCNEYTMLSFLKFVRVLASQSIIIRILSQCFNTSTCVE